MPTPAEVYARYLELGRLEDVAAEFGRKKSWAGNQVKKHREAMAAAESSGAAAGPATGAPVPAGDAVPGNADEIDNLIRAAGRLDLAPTQIRALIQAKRANAEYKVLLGELVTAESLRGTAERIAHCVERVFSQSWALGLATSTGADPAEVTPIINRAVNQLLAELETEIPSEWR